MDQRASPLATRTARAREPASPETGEHCERLGCGAVSPGVRAAVRLGTAGDCAAEAVRRRAHPRSRVRNRTADAGDRRRRPATHRRRGWSGSTARARCWRWPEPAARTRRSPVGFVHGDGAALPFAGVFDAVFSAATLHWIHDHPAVFRSVATALAAGGRFVAQCGGKGNLQRMLEHAEVVMALAGLPRAFRGLARSLEFRRRRNDREPAGRRRADRRSRPGSRKRRSIWAPRNGTPTSSRASASVIISNALPLGLRGPFTQDLTARAAADAPAFTLDYWRLNIDARKPRVIAHYERQVAAHTARRDAEAIVSTRISRLRLATVVPGAGAARRRGRPHLLVRRADRRARAAADLRGAGRLACARRGARRLARCPAHRESLRAGADRPGLGSIAAGCRPASRHRASPIRARSRSVRPGVAAAVARSPGHRGRGLDAPALGARRGAGGRGRRTPGGGDRTGGGDRMAGTPGGARPSRRGSPPRRARRLSQLGREHGSVHGQGGDPAAGSRCW